eukprot:scaffold253_cov72-Cylindrotheca_fusiformis.AAC.1
MVGCQAWLFGSQLHPFHAFPDKVRESSNYGKKQILIIRVKTFQKLNSDKLVRGAGLRFEAKTTTSEVKTDRTGGSAFVFPTMSEENSNNIISRWKQTGT